MHVRACVRVGAVQDDIAGMCVIFVSVFTVGVHATCEYEYTNVCVRGFLACVYCGAKPRNQALPLQEGGEEREKMEG